MQQLYFVDENSASQIEPQTQTLLNDHGIKIAAYSKAQYNFFFREILKTSATDIFLRLEQTQLQENLSFISYLKQHIPEIHIHVYTDNCLMRNIAQFLSSGKIKSCAFGITDEKLLQLFKQPQTLLSYKRVFYEKNEFSYRALAANSETSHEALLILMPAWNNYFPPFGLAHIAGALKSIQLSYDILDLNNEFWAHVRKQKKSTEHYENLVNWNSTLLYKQNISPEITYLFDKIKTRLTPETKYIGFSLFATNINASLEAMQMIKRLRPDIKVFCGGPQGSDSRLKKAIEENHLDAIVIGEGEESTLDLIKSWQNNSPIQPMPGVHLNQEQKFLIGPHRNLMDINHLPLPDFSKFPLYTYEQTMTLPIHSSRGCVAKCSFCSETIYWKKFRALSPENITSMMQESIFSYGINFFHFNDSLMNGSHQLLEDTCDLIIDKKLQVEFTGYSRFDKKLTPELLSKMAQAGCRNIAFGFESGSQKIVDLMNKKVFVDNYESILMRATQAGIKCTVCIIVGFPGESWKDFFATLGKVIKMRKYIYSINLSIMEITKNSLIEKDFAKYNIVNDHVRYWRTKNWSNFYLLRFVRYIIFESTWKLVSGQEVSIGNWNAGYMMFFKKIAGWLRRKFLQKNQKTQTT